ncbi:early nodulin-93-like [Aegilops tauschii subsp. strangulata]|uniref:Early nodulin-93 n=1 Tax=Aegilops tauschii TaxID=37682 RepID=M8C4M3_AEGTA
MAKMSSTATVTRAHLENKLALAKRCSREATLAGAKAAAIATVASAVPTLASVRMLPWARAHLNPTGQALVVCTVAGMAYFVAADKAILSLARRHSYESAPDHLKDTSFAGAAAAAAARPRPPAFFRP